MRELVLLLIILGSIQLHANANEAQKNHHKGKLKLAPPGQNAARTEDPGSATRLLYEDPRNKNSPMAGAESKGPTAAVRATCTDNMGMIYKKGDVGYDGCLRTFSHDQPRLPGDNKRPNSVGFTIGR